MNKLRPSAPRSIGRPLSQVRESGSLENITLETNDPEEGVDARNDRKDTSKSPDPRDTVQVPLEKNKTERTSPSPKNFSPNDVDVFDGRKEDDWFRQAGGPTVTMAASRTSIENGILEISAYYEECPAAFHFLSFICGLVLIIFSILGFVDIFGEGFTSPAQFLICAYNILFGLIILITDTKSEVINSACQIQLRIFKYCPFLLQRFGRALFYIYVGSTAVILWPTHDTLKFMYVGVAGGFLLLVLWLAALSCVQITINKGHKQFP